MAMAPIIGLTLDTARPTGLGKSPRYVIRQNYCDAVALAGATPLCLPHQMQAIEAFADRLDGLVVTGGAFDVDPSLFGDNTRHQSVVLKQDRTAFEWAVTEAMLKRDKPVLGICGGQQLLNVILGGTLIQHIEDEIQGNVLHEQPNPRDEPGHKVKIVLGTLLHRLTGKEEIAVNSAHHQAVKNVGAAAIANAIAPDGVIEGVESRTHRFCLGVQWHPEFALSEADTALFKGLVQAAKA
jgi:putative glutamine amidotransferase